MSNSVTFKFGSTLEGKTIEANDLVAINDGIAKGGNSNYGSIYKGNKILGTTEADKLYTTEDIQIAGGPLETELNKVFKDGKIPAGTSLHEFFKLMACTDTYPLTSSIDGTFKVELSKPSISASIKADSVVEIGTSVTINKISAVASTPNATSAEVSGMTYGYKTTIDGTKNDAEIIARSWRYNVNADDKYSLTASVSGFTGLTNSSDSDADVANCYLDAQTLKVGLGTNKLTVTESGVGYTGSVEGIDSVYIVSNIGSTSEDKKTAAIAAQTNVVKYPANSSKEYKLTGVYPVFGNFDGVEITNSTETKFPIANSTEFTKEYPAETNIRVSFAYPSGRTVTVKFWDKFANAYVDYTGGFTDVTEAKKRIINGEEVQYNLWTRVGENALGATDFKFVLSKSTSEE